MGLRGLDKRTHLRFNARLPVLSSVAVRLVSHCHVHIEDALPATHKQAKAIRAKEACGSAGSAWAYMSRRAFCVISKRCVGVMCCISRRNVFISFRNMSAPLFDSHSSSPTDGVCGPAHSTVRYTQPRVWRGCGACVWGKLARKHGTCEGAGVTARVRLLPAGGSPRSHSMFCQRGKVSATHTARGARPPPRRGS